MARKGEYYNKLTEILDNLYDLTGGKITLYDPSFRVIVTDNKPVCGYCTMLQQNPDTERVCKKEELQSCHAAEQKKTPQISRCRFGLTIAVSPLFCRGALAGYLSISQLLQDSPENRLQTERIAQKYAGQDYAAQILDTIPSCTEERLSACIYMMNLCAEYLSLNNHLLEPKQDLALQVREYINHHYRHKLTIDMLCQKFFCSKGTLINSFKKKYRQTINEYITDLRLHDAQELLEREELTIGEIAERCGFTSQNYFGKVFGKKYGFVPSHYRTNFFENQNALATRFEIRPGMGKLVGILLNDLFTFGSVTGILKIYKWNSDYISTTLQTPLSQFVIAVDATDRLTEHYSVAFDKAYGEGMYLVVLRSTGGQMTLWTHKKCGGVTSYINGEEYEFGVFKLSAILEQEKPVQAEDAKAPWKAERYIHALYGAGPSADGVSSMSSYAAKAK